MNKIKINNRLIEISKEDKILYSNNFDNSEDITKAQIIEYYKNISKLMLPQLKNRPLMMRRYPNGINEKFFYQKNISSYFPHWIKRAKVFLKTQENKYNEYVVCQNEATLIYLSNQAVLEYHIWLSKIDKINYPDKLIFDLDPGTSDFEPLRKCALMLKELLEDLDLVPFLMTTGSHGLHVVAPIKQMNKPNKLIDFVTLKKLADKCAEQIVIKEPNLFTLKIRKESREKKLFIDTLRNQYGATSIAPYSTRAKPNCPIATPIDWQEIYQEDLHSQKYNIKNIINRIKNIEDPWSHFFKSAKNINVNQTLRNIK